MLSPGGGQLDAMDIDGNGVIEPSEFYAYCRKKLCANRVTFNKALSDHQVTLSALRSSLSRGGRT